MQKKLYISEGKKKRNIDYCCFNCLEKYVICISNKPVSSKKLQILGQFRQAPSEAKLPLQCSPSLESEAWVWTTLKKWPWPDLGTLT